jgi:hypothetical protein
MVEERREPRTQVNIQGRYRTGNGIVRDVVVLDLSTHGCKFFDRFSNLNHNSALTVRIGNIGPLDARVRWIESQTVGVRFDTPLHASVLEHMAHTIQDWAPDPERDKLPPERSQMPLQNVIEVRIRPPTEADVRLALRELQMTLPLRTEAEFEAVFHRVLSLIYVPE